jgi:class 3 adenylate cyclase/HAMP domain-containing protein
MEATRKWSWRNLSIRTKMLVIILPLIVMPMLILATVGFVTSSRVAAKTSTRYLKQRENDLRALAENPAIRDYFNNQVYGLREEAEVYRLQLEHSLRRFTERSNSIDLIYPQIRYVDPRGEEVAKVVKGQISSDRGRVAEAPFFLAVQQLAPGETYLSPEGPTMIYAMPVYQPGGVGRAPTFQGAVVLDFVYPLQDFARTTAIIARTFVIITGISLGVALLLTITRVRRLTDPIRRLAEAAHRIAAGQRSVTVAIDSDDEVRRLATAFNEMAASLEQNETALQHKVVETTTLYEIGQEIIAQVALEPTLHLIVERVRQIFQAEVSLLALRQEESDTLVMQAYSGSVPQVLTDLHIRPGEGLGGRVVVTGQPLTVGDYLAEYRDRPFLEIVQEAGLRSGVDVSVLFLDISGYTRLSEQLPPETLNSLLERYFSTFLDRLHEAGGDINETAGDGFMAIFQDADVRRHAIKATETALALLAATEALNRDNHAQPPAIHMGINSGVALVGSTRFDGLRGTRWTFTASGPMTKLAACLASIADAGQILIGPQTVHRLGDRYRLQRLGHELLKNIAEAVDVHHILGPA